MGITQTYGVDYQETCALLAKMNSMRVLNSRAVTLGWNLEQLDVTNAFLHWNLPKKFIWKFPQVSHLQLRMDGCVN